MDIHRLHFDNPKGGSAPSRSAPNIGAAISTIGAELQSLRFGDAEVLWDAGPLWPRHAPLLFPIVGTLKGGSGFALPRHGFARDRAFAWISRSERACVLELRDDAETRACYPFPFQLRVSYSLDEAGFHMGLELLNPGEGPLPASLGLHPAFRWPLAAGLAKTAHRLVFDQQEPGPLRRLDHDGLLTPIHHPTPIQDRVLPLHDGLFSDDALLFLEPRSQGLRLEAEGGPALAFRWEGFQHLGIWAKPAEGPEAGPGFLCIEPWSGHADPADWNGAFSDKPGSFVLAPGDSRRWAFSVAQA